MRHFPGFASKPETVSLPFRREAREDEPVVAGAAVQRVVAGVAEQGVGAGAPGQQVVPKPPSITLATADAISVSLPAPEIRFFIWVKLWPTKMVLPAARSTP